MTTVTPARRTTPSPNQQRKQDQIVAAARTVLVQYGVDGCTERRIATEAGVAKNAVHYYFADMEVLIDRAMAAHVDAFVEGLRAAVDAARDGTAVAALTTAYLTAFDAQPHAALLWFDFWIHAARNGRLAEVTAIEDRMVALIDRALRRDGVADRRARQRTAGDVYTLLLGSVVDRMTRGTGTPQVLRRVRLLLAEGHAR